MPVINRQYYRYVAQRYFDVCTIYRYLRKCQRTGMKVFTIVCSPFLYHSQYRQMNTFVRCAFSVCVHRLINNESVTVPVDFITVQPDLNPFSRYFIENSRNPHYVTVLHILFYRAIGCSVAPKVLIFGYIVAMKLG